MECATQGDNQGFVIWKKALYWWLYFNLAFLTIRSHPPWAEWLHKWLLQFIVYACISWYRYLQDRCWDQPLKWPSCRQGVAGIGCHHCHNRSLTMCTNWFWLRNIIFQLFLSLSQTLRRDQELCRWTQGRRRLAGSLDKLQPWWELFSVCFEALFRHLAIAIATEFFTWLVSPPTLRGGP